MSDFSDRPFVAGSLTGLRSFKADQFGRLTGVSHQDVWRPGVNVAKCNKGAVGAYGMAMAGLSAATMTLAHHFYADPCAVRAAARRRPEPELPAAPEPVSLVKHRPGQQSCGCGFYAYFDGGDNPHHAPDHVLGLVEGYGVTTVGSRGFRCGKARIVALIAPQDRRWWQGWTWNAHALFLFALFNALFVAADLSVGNWVNACLSGGGAIVPAATLLLLRRYKTMRKQRPDYSVLPELVRRNYPDVPVFASVADALAAHPLTPPPVPSPATDADFWTRSTS